MLKVNPTLIFLALYALTGAFPYLGSSDKIHSQMMYLSLLNASSIYYIQNYLSNDPVSLINKYFSKIPIFVFSLFFIWTIITVIPAINIGESLVQLTYYFLQFVSFLCIVIFIGLNKNRLELIIKTVVIALTLIEVIPTLVPYFYDIQTLGEPISRSLGYRGISGSLNVLAFSLALKLPFLHYFLYHSNRYKILYSLLIFLSLYVIFGITKTRGAYLFVYAFYFAAFVFYFLNKNRETRILKSLLNVFYLTLLHLVFSIAIVNLVNSGFKNEENSGSVQDRLSTISIDEYSANSRLRYYRQAFESISENPILGIGTGNWELEGTKKDQANINGYTVPYHVHNDFLEISAESGILGGLLYFFVIFYVIYKLLKQVLIKRKLNKEYLFELTLILSISAYLFDAMLNFPSARALQQINLFIVLAFSIIHLDKNIDGVKLKLSTSSMYILFLLLTLSVYSSLRIYQSSVDQAVLIGKYNTQDFTIDKLWLDQVDTKFPNLATTSVPVKAFKAYFYMRNGFNKEAIDLFNESKKYNPYLYFQEGWKSLAFMNLQESDSAISNAKIAYEKIPNNLVHYGHLLQALSMKKDSVAVKNIFTNHKKKVPMHQQIYLVAIAQILDKDTEGFALNDLNIMEVSDDRNSRLGYYSLEIGYDNTIEAAKYHVLGEYAFDQKQFEQALEYFKLSSELNPFEIPYQENLANTYLQLSRNQDAIDVINNIEKTNTLTNKSIYIRALALISIGSISNACEDLQILINNEFVPNYIFNRFCLNN